MWRAYNRPMKIEKIYISKVRLIHLYNKKRLSTEIIAEIFNCNQETIRRLLIEYKIKRRFREIKFKINLEELKKLYDKKRLSIVQIAKMYNCSSWTIRSNLLKNEIKIRKPNAYHKWKPPANQLIPNIKDSLDLSYMLGVYLGDGWTYKYKNNYFIGLDTIDYEFAKSFYDSLKNLKLNPNVFKKKNRKIWRTIASSKIFLKWLEELKFSKIRKIAYSYPEKFIKGLYESEGCLLRNYDKRVKKEYLSIIIVSCEKETIELVKELIENLGFRPKLNLRLPKPPKKPIWALSLNRQNEVVSFLERIKPCIKI